jgi:cobalamin biosynthesis Co2+ chelatase CbiK
MKESQRFLNTRTYGLGKVHGGVHARQVMCPSSLSSRPHVLTPSCFDLCCTQQAESYPLVESVVKALEDEGLQTIKVIREFIVSDSNKALDNGWLEPLPA